MTKRFGTILIANRGEIALRIMRTARSLGYRVIAIASEADRDAPHARFADRTVIIGPAPVDQSYLNQDAIIAAARETGAEAIHPGYGFLSENASFAERVAAENLVFIGPSPGAIRLMGDKAAAKRAMIEAGVPCIPGYQSAEQDTQRFEEAAKKAGYPVMIKASAGGGGRGMRRVSNPSGLAAALSEARQEAQKAFGSGELILEKAVDNARHIEIQVFGDASGQIIALGERDCSLQRRHQKVIEEAPSPALDENLREEMSKAAIAAARAVDYIGAGTVEFLLDDDGNFFFLEMNTRLQVEHPVTEAVTGLDLVALQLRVAQGNPLPVSQDEVDFRGHAIEARLYAEDVPSGFMPSTGPILLWKPPEGIRVDAGIASGQDVSPHYDPMLAKLVAHGTTREEARLKLIHALEETALLGVETNRLFLLDLLRGEAFSNGEARTRTIGTDPPSPPMLPAFVPALAACLQDRLAFASNPAAVRVPEELRYWTSGPAIERRYRYAVGETEVHALLTGGPDRFEVRAGGETHAVAVTSFSEAGFRAAVDGRPLTASFACSGDLVLIEAPGFKARLTDLEKTRSGEDETAAEGAVTANMHAQVTEVYAEEGATVEKGQRLALLEAMKMQHVVTAPVAGRVVRIPILPQGQVAAGDLLILVEPFTE